MDKMTVWSIVMNGNMSIIDIKVFMHGNVLISWSTENPYLLRSFHQSSQVLFEKSYKYDQHVSAVLDFKYISDTFYVSHMYDKTDGQILTNHH